MNSLARTLSAGIGSDQERSLSGDSAQQVDTRTLIILAFSATAGVLVEFYDLAVFVFAVARAFPTIFIPKLPPSPALGFS